MTVIVHFFASLREQTGRSRVTLEHAGPMDIHTVWSKASDGQLMPSNTLCAINMEYVKHDSNVEDGDEVAFFPPVTGG